MNNNKYYVYVHRDTSGNIFYVGSGTGPRWRSTTNRSEKWHEVSTSGYSSEKVWCDLVVTDAREIEELLIQLIGIDKLVNKHLPMKTITLNENVLAQFKYSEESPSGLVWAAAQPRGAKPHEIGQIAGGRESRNNQPHRWRVKPMNTDKSVAVHRIVWALHFPISEDKVIDHIDGNPWNNRIENLREVDRATNSRNTKKHASNKSGVTGVNFKRNRDGHTYWTATWRDGTARSRGRSFMIEKYGYDEAFKLACDFRKNKIEELRAKGFDYTDRHTA